MSSHRPADNVTPPSSPAVPWLSEASRRTGAGSIFDPYPRFAELRAESQVHPASFFELFDVGDPIAEYWEGTPRFSTLGYAATEAILKDPDTYSSAGIRRMTEKQFGAVSLMASDPPEHGRYRALVQPAFSRRGLDTWERWLNPRLDELIDNFAAAGQVDLYTEYCAKFPVYVISMALGVDACDVDQFHEWATLLQIGAASPEKAEEASTLVSEYMLRVVEARRLTPEDDLISLLVQSEINEGSGPKRLSDEQILGFVRNILPAGAGTTFRTLGITLITLLERPALLQRLYDHRELVPMVVDEVLRWNGPVTFAARTAVTDSVVAGVEIPAGALIEVGIGPANRDPARFECPDDFDPFRAPKSHLAFSTGPHFCVGMQIARLELHAGLERLLDRLPNLRLDADAESPAITGLWYRMPTGVPVTFG